LWFYHFPWPYFICFNNNHNNKQFIAAIDTGTYIHDIKKNTKQIFKVTEQQYTKYIGCKRHESVKDCFLFMPLRSPGPYWFRHKICLSLTRKAAYELELKHQF
jgi:hypothetical protein